MKTSPLQLKQLVLTRVIVEPFPLESGAEPISAPEFDFEGVNVASNIKSGFVEEQKDDPRDFFVELLVKILGDKGKPPPYRVEVGAMGLFQISEHVPSDTRSDIVLVNGASLLYGSIREVVSNITARSVFGQLLLPTMNFQDHRKSNQEPPENKAESPKPQ